MDSVISDAMTYSYSDSNILICGETGTGKELFAQSIHNSSPRKTIPLWRSTARHSRKTF
ncbi:MAG: sigma 54-interacting transcriptional regulator [Clostridium sp.]